MERSHRFLLLLGLLFLAVAALWVRSRFGPGEAGTPKTLPPASALKGGADPALTEKFLALEAGQKRLDETIWAKEILAEAHEDVFIKLWDELRGATDKFAVLQRFEFGALKLPSESKTQPHESDVGVTRFAGAVENWAPEKWREFLAKLEREGYTLAETEWRSPEFEVGTDGSARSVIALAAHLLRPAAGERFIVKTKLQVTWRGNASAGAAPVPETIAATELEIVARQGEPAFAAVSTEVIEDKTDVYVDPLIVYDLNGDGLSEVILGGKNLVYRNRGRGRFERDRLCREPPREMFTSIIADFNGDSVADFLCADRAGLWLFRGDGAGNFPTPGERVWSAPAPLMNPFVITAGDIDADGDLDVWLAQYKLPYLAGQMPTPYYDSNDGFPSFLLVNDGHGNFHEATESAGLAGKRFRRTYSASLVDLDDDGDLDLVVVSDFAGVDLYQNDGHGHFTDVTARKIDEPHSFGMAHAFGDFDLDGRLDLFVIGMNSVVAQRLDYLRLGRAEFPDHQAMRAKMAYGNRLYLARGDRFEPAPFGDQVAQSGWSWGVTAADFDNDGDLDLYIANGHRSRGSAKDYEPQFWCHDIYVATSAHDPVTDVYFQSNGTRRYGAGQSYGGYCKNQLLLNEAGKSFLQIGHLMGVALEDDSRNVVSEDWDGDGKLDLLVTTWEVWPRARQTLRFFQNQWPAGGNWIGVRLREGGPGFSPIGARITLNTRNGKQIRRLVTGDSYRSQHSTTAHFGLGAQTEVASLEIRWPNGRVKLLERPAINRYLDVTP